MKIIDLRDVVPPECRRAVVAVGNFDAVHRGHRFLIETAVRQAREQGRPSAVLTFEPHPRRVFRPDDAPFRVTPYALKLERLAATGVDIVYICPFDWALAGLSPDEFVTSVLTEKINPAGIVVGQDFRFGHNRAGNAAFLRNYGLSVTAVTPEQDQSHGVISASRIRGAIQAGHIDEANALLGWDWEIRGTVGHGDKRGRTIGYPTANVALGETLHPAYGVYATLVRIDGEDLWRPAATNIGIRPMFEVPTGLVEAYLLDFDGDLYDRTLHIRPVRKIRDEMKFDGLDSLVKQIKNDCTTVRAILDRNHFNS